MIDDQERGIAIDGNDRPGERRAGDAAQLDVLGRQIGADGIRLELADQRLGRRGCSVAHQ